MLGRPRRRRVRRRQDVQAALDRYKEAFDVLGAYVADQGYDLRFAIEPKPNEPRGDILLPTIGHALAFIQTLEYSGTVGLNPEVGHEKWYLLRARPRPGPVAGQAVPHRPERPARPPLRPGPPLRRLSNTRGAFWVVDLIDNSDYSGPIHFDFKPPRTEDDEGVWESAAACMRNWLILREKVRAFRADPDVQDALRQAKVAELAQPTLAEGEDWRSVRNATADAETLGARRTAFEHLDQLALEHLYGTR